MDNTTGEGLIRSSTHEEDEPAPVHLLKQKLDTLTADKSYVTILNTSECVSNHVNGLVCSNHHSATTCEYKNENASTCKQEETTQGDSVNENCFCSLMEMNTLDNRLQNCTIADDTERHCDPNRDDHEWHDSQSCQDVENLEEDQIEPDILDDISYVVYKSEHQMPDIMRLITKDLSEPYSIYTYRYFIHNWPKLCFLAMDNTKCVGAIVCKLDLHKKVVRRGYIAMLAVDKDYRRRKIGSHLVLKAIRAMISDDCDEVVLETEITNRGALHLYENLGFVRDKRLFRYYLNGVDALRLKLWLR